MAAKCILRSNLTETKTTCYSIYSNIGVKAVDIDRNYFSMLVDS